ncbi:MAG: type II toxin-antitoxin system VapC family toxin [Candidatus Electrothrix sp. EH2]|nr:type II toxin-antitoxin system VapC family toxin [Candidatus Electrothrix sp. EH2]
MRILLDTCTFLWITRSASQLSDKAAKVFEAPDNAVFLSSISAWEISVKWNMGKLHLPYPPEQFIPRERKRHFIEKLHLAEEDTFSLSKLPDIHKDPFDRILICQAIENGLTILTSDRYIQQYPVKTLW